MKAGDVVILKSDDKSIRPIRMTIEGTSVEGIIPECSDRGALFSCIYFLSGLLERVAISKDCLELAN